MTEPATPKVIEVSAPLRVDLAGSWCDCPQYTDRYDDAHTVSLAIWPGARCRIEQLPTRTQAHLSTPDGLPIGCGLGSSAALAVAHVAAVRLAGQPDRAAPLDRLEIAEAGYRCERSLSGQLVGRQDHYAAALGGLRSYHWGLTSMALDVRTTDLSADASTLAWLTERATVFYTGVPRHSGDVHRELWDHLTADRVALLRDMARGALATSDALSARDETRLGELIDEQRALVERLYPGATVAELGTLPGLIREPELLGSKALGAGGGGCVLVLHRPDARDDLRQAIGDALGWTVWKYQAAAEGLSVATDNSAG